MVNVTYDQVRQSVINKGYAFFENSRKDYNLNLIGIRNPNSTPNSFDDTEVVAWISPDGTKNIHLFPITTDPGLYYLNNPEKANETGSGTAIVKEGQYRGLWKMGLHNSSYTALVQKNPVTVIRDFDRDSVLDFSAPPPGSTMKEIVNGNVKTVEWYDATGKLVWREQTGMFYINNHRANANGQSTSVDKWSAGCQVLQNKYDDKLKKFQYDFFIELCQKAKANYGDSFSYTLINEKDLV